MSVKAERCPWCDRCYSRGKFLEIESKIREQERKRLADAEVQMRKRLEEKFQRILPGKAGARRARRSWQQNRSQRPRRSATRWPQRSRPLRHVSCLILGNKVQDEATKQVATVLAESKQMAEKLKLAEANVALRAQAQQETERLVKLRLEEAEQLRQKELVNQRLILVKDRDQALLKERVGFTRERESWKKN